MVVLAIVSGARGDDVANARLLKWIPADANAIAIIDVEALFRSPLSVRENWKKKTADRFVNQEIMVPPDARRAVMSSQLDLGGGLQPVWELAIVDLGRTPSFALIARREGGQLDTIATRPAVKLGSGRTAVELETGVVLGTDQPSRQAIARWLSGASGTSRLSPFLKGAVERADKQAQLVMALDLTDSVTAPRLRKMLEQFEPLQGKTADQADIAEILASVKGVLASVHVTDKRDGTVLIEFGKPTALMQRVAKPLVDEMMSQLEISLPDLDSWTATASGNSLVLKGEFSEGDLRRIVSLFAVSSPTRQVGDTDSTESAGSDSSPPAASSERVKAEASRKYFQSIKHLVDELRKTLGGTRDNHNVWMERYARKIDDLPIKDVDNDLPTFGGNVSSSIRYQAQAGRMGALRAGVREAQPVYQSYSYGAGAVGPYGSYAGYSASGTVRVAPDRAMIRIEEHANAAQVKISEMKQIDDGMVQIRRAMTQKYNVEF